MNDFFLIVGLSTESITSKIAASGARYVHKRLESTPENWGKISNHLENPALAGAVVTLTERNYAQLVSDKYRESALRLLKALAKAPNLVLIHEAVFGGAGRVPPQEDAAEEWDGFTWNDYAAREHFGDIDESLRLHVNEVLDSHGIAPTVYKHNIEVSTLAVDYIDDRLNNLLFRIYLPAGRLFEEETAQLLALFHEWLLSVRGQKVRQAGYHTANGRVVEFFGEGRTSAEDWTTEIRQFNDFVSLIDDQRAAERMLVTLGLSNIGAEAVVSRYAKRLRRIQLDAKHERQRRVLSIRQELEAELSDHEPGIDASLLDRLIETLVPTGPSSTSCVQLGLPRSAPEQTIHVNQQFFGHVEGIVAQNINGTVTQGSQPEELLKLIHHHGGGRADDLLVAVRELADASAPKSTRLSAKQRLKAFLLKTSEQTSTAAIAIVQKWIEQQVGL